MIFGAKKQNTFLSKSDGADSINDLSISWLASVLTTVFVHFWKKNQSMILADRKI